MLNISSFLQKISHKINSSELNTASIAEIISSVSGINCQPKDIEIKDVVVYTNLSPGAKNKIFLYKDSILEKIAKNTTFKITDIR